MMSITRDNNDRISKSILWFARGSSIISINLLFLFMGGEALQVSLLDLKEWVGFFFFPCGVILGMVIAWWREGSGGLITTGSLLAFYILYGLALNRQFPDGWAFLLFSTPGILFLIYRVSAHRRQKAAVKRKTPLPEKRGRDAEGGI